MYCSFYSFHTFIPSCDRLVHQPANDNKVYLYYAAYSNIQHGFMFIYTMCVCFMGECTLFLLTLYWTLLLHCVHTVAGVAYCWDDDSQCLAIFSLGINIWFFFRSSQQAGIWKKNAGFANFQLWSYEWGHRKNYRKTICMKGYKWLSLRFFF